MDIGLIDENILHAEWQIYKGESFSKSLFFLKGADVLSPLLDLK